MQVPSLKMNGQSKGLDATALNAGTLAQRPLDALNG